MPNLADSATLECGYFAGNAVDIAFDLIGRSLTVTDAHRVVRATIVETEAYRGTDDPASHAAFRPGGRASLMRGAPGLIYIYAAYGMYPCLNIVTEPEGEPSAVLIRGIHIDGEATPVLGPGRLTRALGITLDDHGLSVCGGRFSVSTVRIPYEIDQTRRIGVTRGQDIPWRFVGASVVGAAE